MVRATDFDAATLATHKGGTTVSVCLPARNEAATIAAIVHRIKSDLMDSNRLVDEILVLDDHSSDDTAAVAAAAGATVAHAGDLLAEFGWGTGKGEAMWKALAVSKGDLVIYCDADLKDFDSAFIVGLLGPLIENPLVAFVKGFYDRPFANREGEGGRVTELVARPLISLLFPELVHIRQPLGGEYGGRRWVLERLSFVQGYGVDISMLVDIARAEGVDSIAQVDLGVRHHRNRSLRDLGPQALSIIQACLIRSGRDHDSDVSVSLFRPDVEEATLTHTERPPLITVPQYRSMRNVIADH